MTIIEKYNKNGAVAFLVRESSGAYRIVSDLEDIDSVQAREMARALVYLADEADRLFRKEAGLPDVDPRLIRSIRNGTETAAERRESGLNDDGTARAGHSPGTWMLQCDDGSELEWSGDKVLEAIRMVWAERGWKCGL